MASTDVASMLGGARQTLNKGVVIPAHPLAVTAGRQLDERRQRALSRYYLAAGAGGLAVGVHTTQFRIHDPKLGWLKPVLALAAEEMNRVDGSQRSLVRVAGICGDTQQAVGEAELARELGYSCGLVSFGQWHRASIPQLLDHCRAVADVISVFGFYLQPKVGGIELPVEFWRGLCAIENVVAVKVAAFDRYRTLDVIRAVVESGRDDIALYTGNDDHIVLDLLTPHRVQSAGRATTRYFAGGLLGQWAVWTARAVPMLRQCQQAAASDQPVPAELLRLAAEVTDANGAIFDAQNGFRGCIAGIHEVLRRQGLLAGGWLLDDCGLSPGQAAEIDRVCRAYPHLADDSFVAERLDDWLNG
ncbi:MAG: dihydrodipicolinate synthase family protein [Pirellulales bacterium]|nr:dihydrodipicolinate synthase family protein [Pirellulales bacterium]